MRAPASRTISTSTRAGWPPAMRSWSSASPIYAAATTGTRPRPPRRGSCWVCGPNRSCGKIRPSGSIAGGWGRPMSQLMTGSNTDLASAAAEAEARYVAANPESKRRHEAAVQHMPGGNTRTVLFYSPFPVVLKGGEGCHIQDVDGHTYTDYLGEYTAGLYGHSNPALQAALRKAVDDGFVLGGHNMYEADLAAEMCRRFPSLERVRFTNSGTEGNLLAVSAARLHTGRSHIMVFHGAYHG